MIANTLYVIAVLALAAGVASRLPRWNKRSSRPLTLALAALLPALLLRHPKLGDDTLDNALLRATGLANIPDITAHVLSVLAAAAIAHHALAACKRPVVIVRTVWALALLAVVAMIGWWLTSLGSKTVAVNMVQLPGMAGYSAIFASAFAVPQAIMFYATTRALRDGCRERVTVNLLRGGSIAGLAFSVHRLVVAVAPSIAEFYYLPIAWSLAGATVALYGLAGASNLVRSRGITSAA